MLNLSGPKGSSRGNKILVSLPLTSKSVKYITFIFKSIKRMENNLNLARKWRSKNFNEIVGQELSVRMLKNSLYKGHHFPVYLFSGQRGCGKTTTARVFAAALNCDNLEQFRKNPKKNSIPCLVCNSCKAMLSGKHPDFIEMDAASHTGVDMIRQVIDAASFLPLMGSKKIYLIDEAHMLSKAAFNALLKILEEPPPSVLFILATTDPHKIIDTVKSRCFQLFFRSVDTPILNNYLHDICTKEQISFDNAGLSCIIKETEGSVRDALNLLEQVRFSSARVTKESVLQVLGYLDDTQLLDLFDAVLNNGPAHVLQKIKNMKLDTYAAEFIWRRLVDLSRALLWVKHGVQPQYFVDNLVDLKQLASACSFKKLNHVLDMLYTNESVFLKTTAKHALLEMILLQLCQHNDTQNNAGGSSAPQQAVAPMAQSEDVQDYDEEDDEFEDEEEEEEVDEALYQSDDNNDLKWTSFVTAVKTLEDPLLNSVFSQGTLIKFDSINHQLDIEFSKDLAFFNDWLTQSREQWLPLLQKLFGQAIVFNPLFTGDTKVSTEKKIITQEVVPKNVAAVNPVQKTQKPVHVQSQRTSKAYQPKGFQRRGYGAVRKKINKEPIIDVSDGSIWKKTNLVLHYFPGTVHEVRE